MMKEIKLNYKGLTIVVAGNYIKGAGYFNVLDPPEEDEFIIDEYNITSFNSIEDLRDFILSDSMLNHVEIELMCLEKCKE